LPLLRVQYCVLLFVFDINLWNNKLEEIPRSAIFFLEVAVDDKWCD